MKKKGKKKGYMGLSLIAVILVVAVISNILASTYSTMIGLYFRSSKNAETKVSAEEALKNANDMTQQLEEDGAVMLKNSMGADAAALPLAKGTKINLFGNCSYQTLYQGSGSASSWFKQDLNVNLKKGLENAGFEVNPGLWKFYEDNAKERKDQKGGMANMSGADHSILEESMDLYKSYSYNNQNILDYSKNYSDVAVVVIGRAGGEGSDAALDMKGCAGGDDGKSYLQLQNVELELLDYVEQNYSKVIILLNTPMQIECGFLENDKIAAAIWMGMPGTTGNNAIGEILAGTINPSGHLTDTYAYDATSAPSYYNFGDFSYANYKSDANKYVHYQEGIYVGYRYYETAATDGYIDYDKTVQYPFGYGLSYTSFDWKVKKTELGKIGGQITVDVEVTNTGKVAGKDVVQLYYSAPYDAGENIEKSSIDLGAFAKTGVIEPGKSQTVTLTMKVDDMSSYDYRNSKSYVLSQGDYALKLQTDSHHIKTNSDGKALDPINYKIDSKVIYSDADNGKRSTDVIAATNLFDHITAGDGDFGENGAKTKYISRSDWAGTMPKSRSEAENMNASDAVIKLMSNNYAGSSFDFDKIPDAKAPVTGKKNNLEISDMRGLKYDDPKWQKLIEEMSVEELAKLVGSCGWSNPAVLSINKAVAIDMDGAEGLHDLTKDKTSNQYVGSVVRGCTWDTELAYKFGNVYGDECLTNGVSGMYGFTVNIHRSPFGGRAFESYSEDGLLSGKIAAQEVAGLQNKEIAVYLKHFCLNDQETNRSGVHTWANEQAIREIYARPFEIVTKEANCTGYMSSYNYVGAGWSSADYNLLTALPRGEWNFTGRIVTDAAFDPKMYNPDAGLVAGTNMFLTPMGTKFGDKITGTNFGIQTLQEAAHRQLYIYANGSAINIKVQGINTWKYLVAGLDAVFLLLIALITFTMVIPAFRRKEKKENL